MTHARARTGAKSFELVKAVENGVHHHEREWSENSRPSVTLGNAVVERSRLIPGIVTTSRQYRFSSGAGAIFHSERVDDVDRRKGSPCPPAVHPLRGDRPYHAISLTRSKSRRTNRARPRRGNPVLKSAETTLPFLPSERAPARACCLRNSRLCLFHPDSDQVNDLKDPSGFPSTLRQPPVSRLAQQDTCAVIRPTVGHGQSFLARR
jgi:hypothetical protein